MFEEGDDTKIMRVLAVYSFANIICAGVVVLVRIRVAHDWNYWRPIITYYAVLIGQR